MTTPPLPLSKLTIVLAAASLLTTGCATAPAGTDSATLAVAAVAATGAANAATENASPIAGHASAEAGSGKAGNGPAVAAAAAAAAAAAVAAQQKPFADVIKDAREQPGFFNVYSKEDKVWLEIPPERIDQPFFLQVNRTQGIGERDPFASPMLRSYIVEFHRLGNLVQLIAKNSQFIAAEGTPLARAVRESTSDSLLGAVPVASQPHPERKSVLIELDGDANRVAVDVNKKVGVDLVAERLERARSGLSHLLRVRFAQLELYRNPQRRRPDRLRRFGPLRGI